MAYLIWKNLRLNFPIILILLIIGLVYSSIFANQFIGDDFDFFVNWSSTQSFEGVGDIVRGANPTQHVGNYRPLKNLTILTSRQVFKDWMPGYHLISLGTHLTIVYLIYLITLKLSNHKSLSHLSALLFGLHPIHTEAVTFITASYDTIGFMFGLSSFYLYLLSVQGKTVNATPRKNLLISNRHLILSYLFLIISFLFNEITLIIPVLIALHYWLYVGQGSFVKPKLIQTFNAIRPFFIIAIGHYLFRTYVLDIPTRGSYQADNFYLSLLVSLKSVVEYLKTYLWPINLSTSHTLPGNIVSYNYQKYNLAAVQAQSITDPSVLISLLIISCLLFCIYHFRKTKPVISFSIGWALVSLLPVINLLPTALIFSERYAYLSSIGFCLLLAFVVIQVSEIVIARSHRQNNLVVLASILVPLSIFYATQTYQRNQDWQNELVFWQQETKQHPHNPLMHLVLGRVHHKNNRLDQAISTYTQATNLAPDLYEAHQHLGDIYQLQQNIPLAIQAYQTVLQYHPNDSVASHNLNQLCAKYVDLCQP